MRKDIRATKSASNDHRLSLSYMGTKDFESILFFGNA